MNVCRPFIHRTSNSVNRKSQIFATWHFRIRILGAWVILNSMWDWEWLQLRKTHYWNRNTYVSIVNAFRCNELMQDIIGVSFISVRSKTIAFHADTFKRFRSYANLLTAKTTHWQFPLSEHSPVNTSTICQFILRNMLVDCTAIFRWWWTRFRVCLW